MVLQFPPGTIGAGWVDVDIDKLDTGLRPPVSGTGMPGPVAEPNITDLREGKASPLSLGQQAALAPTAELISQRNLFAFGVAENVRAKLAR